MLEFFQCILKFLNSHGIPYMFDFVINFIESNVKDFASAFSNGYYGEIDSVKDAFSKKSMFNMIDHASGFKADFIILRSTEYRKVEFEAESRGRFFWK